MPPPSRKKARPASVAERSSAGKSSSGSESPKQSSVTKPDISLFMDCVSEELSEVQKDFYKKKMTDFKDTMKRLEELGKAGAKAVTSTNGDSVTMRLTETTTSITTTTTQAQAATSGIQIASVQSNAPTSQAYRLLVDQKTGRVIGTLPTGSLASSVASPGGVVSQVQAGARVMPISPAPTISTPRMSTSTRGNKGGRGRGSGNSIRLASPAQPRQTVAAASSSPTAAANAKGGGPPVVDLTRGPDPVGAPPLRKQFPALSVQARAQKSMGTATSKRSDLDMKVKSLLVQAPSKFTEWLMQQGLVRSEQYDRLSNGDVVKLKLGMYPDPKKFQHSGGYVWLNEDNTQKVISVFRGSIFEAGTKPIPPSTVLKLIYHWCCQTNIPNVGQWVKVDNPTIDKFYKMCRAVCVSAVQDEVVNLGWSGKVVEIGVISLGTSTQDGSKREVKVEVLGVLDRSTRDIRLRATEPIAGATQQERFGRIFAPLPKWITKNSKIITDYSVDKESLTRLGFNAVTQCSLTASSSARPESTNRQIMDYLKRVVPKMFQNALSNLTPAVIQQFLDELSFREMFGAFPLACFDTFLQKLASITQNAATKHETVEQRLVRVCENPFADWTFSKRVDIGGTTIRSASNSKGGAANAGSNPQSVRSSPSPAPSAAGAKRSFSPDVDDEALLAKKLKGTRETVELESYFLASMQGDAKILNAEFKADMAFKCQLCKKVFMNNIEYMKHLHLHVETHRENAIDFADLSQCRYCYRDFDSQANMQEHIEKNHDSKDLNHCRICLEKCTTQTKLILHMLNNHFKHEMPYSCKVCGFRSSLHKDVIEHFQEAHDRTDKLQCPLCLKTCNLHGEKGYNSQVATAFMQHLQKHEDLKGKRTIECKKCCLIFINDTTLKAHLDADHVSFKEYGVDVEPFMCEGEPIIIPRPDEKVLKLAPKKPGTLAKTPAQLAAFAAQNLEDVLIYEVDKDKCCECDRSMVSVGHYTAYLCCTKCRYSSCCSKAMSVHVQLFHSKGKREFSLGRPVVLESDMFCCCGFSSNSGNKMAKHLAKNNCRSAYPSNNAAKKARQGGADIDDDSDDEDYESVMSPMRKPDAEIDSRPSKTKNKIAKSAKSLEQAGSDGEAEKDEDDKDEDAADDNDKPEDEDESQMENDEEKEEEEEEEEKADDEDEEEEEDEDGDKDGDNVRVAGGPILFGIMHRSSNDDEEEEKKSDGEEEKEEEEGQDKSNEQEEETAMETE